VRHGSFAVALGGHLLRAALDSILREPGFDPTWAPADRPLLDALEPDVDEEGLRRPEPN
jgi:hypothetical protein